jgi:hypothetical protein
VSREHHTFVAALLPSNSLTASPGAYPHSSSMLSFWIISEHGRYRKPWEADCLTNVRPESLRPHLVQAYDVVA